ncbi:hypothetical protein [Paenibacillus sp. FSL R7-0652]|jgi:hypothetical protein|uniref:hypothetical protein n=1 Tax=Paenibacillus sp. FSL R7-0652 TaxID=2921687 RepID=UPI00315A9C3E
MHLNFKERAVTGHYLTFMKQSKRVGAKEPERVLMGQRLLIVFAVMFSIGLVWSSAAVHGEGIGLNVNAEKAWNTVLDKADAQTRRSLQQSYESAGKWKIQKEMWEQKTKQLRTENAAVLVQLKKRIRDTDAAKLAALQETLEHTQARYEPLFQLYTSLNKQRSAAKAVQNKEWSAAVRAQTDKLKSIVQLAREDIRAKKKDLAEARKRKNTEVKRLRTMLKGTGTVKKQIQTARKQVSLSRERYSNVLRSFKQTLKKGQPARVLNALGSVVSSAERWASANRNLYTLEQKVTAIYVKVSQEIKSSS